MNIKLIFSLVLSLNIVTLNCEIKRFRLHPDSMREFESKKRGLRFRTQQGEDIHESLYYYQRPRIKFDNANYKYIAAKRKNKREYLEFYTFDSNEDIDIIADILRNEADLFTIAWFVMRSSDFDMIGVHPMRLQQRQQKKNELLFTVDFQR